MEIAGFIKNSFVDYPGVIASVVFTPFCNFNCWYCHNFEIISQKKGEVEEKTVIDFLNERKGFIDGLVISGGEPTLQDDLFEFISKIKAMGFKVKLDTNGTNLPCLKKLISANLLDYIAMDIKAPVQKYQKIIQKSISPQIILDAINFIQNCGVAHEFRTTFSPDLTEQDIVEIANIVGKNSNFALQQYNKHFDSWPEPHSEEFVLQVASKVKKQVKSLCVRGIKRNF